MAVDAPAQVNDKSASRNHPNHNGRSLCVLDDGITDP